MKNFSSFLKSKKIRDDHFTWGDGDTVTVESLEEWTADKPLKHDTDYYGRSHHQYHAEPEVGSSEHTEFMDHHRTLSEKHKEHRNYYKGDSYSTNRYLRTGKVDPADWDDGKHTEHERINHLHDHIKHMDEVTSHVTKHHHTLYRSGIPKDPEKFPAGHKFQDHGYTGTSFRHDVAQGFTHDKKHQGKRIMHVIHAPKGTKAHYVDVNRDTGLSSEHEVVLHRGTKFKVTHHSHDRDFHYIHSRVISHNPKSLPHGEPGKRFSKTGWEEHHKKKDDNHGVIMTKHEDEKNPEVKHKIKIHITPEQQKGLDHLKQAQLAAAHKANNKQLQMQKKNGWKYNSETKKYEK